MKSKTLALGIALAMSHSAPGQDGDIGISKELADDRSATIANVAYDLRFSFEKSKDGGVLFGSVSFDLVDRPKPGQVVVLDYAGPAIEDFKFNGNGSGFAIVNGKVRLAASLLKQSGNKASFRLPFIAKPTGTPLTVYRDPKTDERFFYTLVVPSDAHRLFPCFDQPDLKARFLLGVYTRDDLVVIGNGAITKHSTAPVDLDTVELYRKLDKDFPQSWETEFSPTAPLPTYLFAFATGPFDEVVDTKPSGIGTDPTRPLRLYCRKSQLDDLEPERIFQMHRDSLAWLGTYFDTPYPFGKLDLVLLPGFPYGGMEHAGAIFYREAALVFDHEPTESELLRRSTLIYHEVSHQWFGNLVTMEWFDDLWLKEGFATFMGYTLLDVLEPGKNAWLRFHQRVKPRAYAIDSTEGTTPIFQELANLADAKSAYGAIVYNKAPAVIRELHARLGAGAFRKGVQLFLKRHAYGNATWQDLAKSFDEASERDNSSWSDRWILGAGMPRVRAAWDEVGGKLTKFSVTQQAVQANAVGDTWPLSLEVCLVEKDGTTTREDWNEDIAGTWLSSKPARNAPVCVILNPTDVAYGLFVLDEKSAAWLCDHAQNLHDLLLRATAMSALWNTVREAELDPRRYLDAATRLLLEEDDAETHAWLLGTIGTALGRYLPETDATPRRDALAKELLTQLEAGMPGRALQTLRFLVRQASTEEVHTLAQSLLAGDSTIPHLALGDRDRFLLAASLLAHGDPTPLEAEITRAGDKDVQKQVFMARAASADAATKARYIESYDQLGEPPEQWMQDSLSFFHWPGQSTLTEPHLAHALSRVDWVKQNRRIFFMPAWLDEFINAHSSATALATVEAFLDDTTDLSTDIRRKILQSLDGLKRTVRIRAAFD